MVWYLYCVTGDEYLKLEDLFGLLVAAISSDLYDFSLYILGRHPHLAIRYDQNRETALHVLARKPSAFASGIRLGIWEQGIYLCWFHTILLNLIIHHFICSTRNPCKCHSHESNLPIIIANIFLFLLRGIHVELPNKSKCGSNNSRSQASVNNYDGPLLTGLLWLAVKLRGNLSI
ncbi:hypothetical protein F0562_001520 [Nyssa sinensis]|uniref:Uncharacterized protein n=1 Tax=Nyssa sinensis TaxID=561372 RepID=A0A5J5C4D8_9ASTE|nr:hypothetical protein F0562_001520 [Nyssa sinensis]